MKRSVAAACLLSCAAAAHAHGLKLDVQADRGFIQGVARYGDTSPVAGEPVAIFVPADAPTPTVTLVTAADGRFSWQATSSGLHRIVLEADEGHSATRTLEVVVPSAHAAAAVVAGVSRAELDAALAPLREEIATLRRQWRLTDLLAGIGYLLGAAGLVAWTRAGRKPS